jgi:catechol 1,2-dioxygenase
MKRATFIKQSSLLALSVGVFGKITSSGQGYIGNTPTTTDILGPFYRPDAPLRSNLIPAGETGEVLHLSGTVYDEKGKMPLPNALVEVWHCDEHGVYDNTSDAYRFRGAVRTGSDGKYYFKTLIPVPYKDSETHTRPAHIHMRISGTRYQDLITQVYFKDDSYIPGDISSSSPLSAQRILTITQNAANQKEVDFDITMAKEYPLDPAVLELVTGLYQTENTMAEFYKKGDLLFMKWNGQIMEAMEYKGNNSFEGGLGFVKARFEPQMKGAVKAIVTYIDDDRKEHVMQGTKLIKYRE